MNYRREIDGLRALAVLPVILFHAGFQSFSGGYVGVDVFFVISGYLITSIIIDEQKSGSFTILKFYERRARRVLPALFVVMLACLPFAWLWLLPADAKNFSQSLIAVSGFASNILFWRTSGYFDAAAELKPLLHTWSLAVEEQYYLFFPVFLIVAWRLGKKSIVFILAIAAIASLIAAQWGSINRPTAAFYLLPSRGWELLIGAFAAFYLWREEKTTINQTLGNAGATLGFILIVFAVFKFDQNTPFPGLYAIIPTLGTVLIILFATNQTWIGKLLGHRVLVGVGLISYSAYLWHQPLFAFARQRTAEEPGKPIFALLAITSMVLAYASWRYVETPFRNRQKFSRRQIFSYAAAFSLLFIAIGAAGNFSNGFEGRLTEEERAIAAYSGYDYSKTQRSSLCQMMIEQNYSDFADQCIDAETNEGLLIWGDSHAAALSFGLSKSFPHLIQFTASSCPPVLGFKSKIPHCEEINNFVVKKIAELKPKEIFLHAAWSAYDFSPGEIENSIAKIKAASPSSKITIIGGVPIWKPTLPVYLLKNHVALSRELSLPMPLYEKVKAADSAMAAIAQTAHVGFFSVLESICRNDICPVIILEGDKGLGLMTWDSEHLTSAGSLLVARRIMLKEQPPMHRYLENTPDERSIARSAGK